MNFEPQKFFIGLIDFFAILLPGAILTYFLRDGIGPLLMLDDYSRLSTTEGGLVFLFSSYLLGHFIFLLGSWLLDDLYDVIRKATYRGQISRLSEGKKLSVKLARWLASRFFKKEVDQTVDLATRIKNYYLKPSGTHGTINTFQWSKARLTLEYPHAIETVHRFEADSKFFRSLIVVLCILIPWGLVVGRSAIVLASLPLLGLAFWRYIDQRLKAINQAYWYVITLEGLRENGFRQSAAAQTSENISHAGGVVFKQNRSNHVEYLLITAKNSAQEWVLPKGHIELGENAKMTAVREVQEETGHWARIVSTIIDNIHLGADASAPVACFFLMECIEKGNDTKGRKQKWLSLNEAKSQAIYPETNDLLEKAEKVREEWAKSEQKHSNERLNTMTNTILPDSHSIGKRDTPPTFPLPDD